MKAFTLRRNFRMVLLSAVAVAPLFPTFAIAQATGEVTPQEANDPVGLEDDDAGSDSEDVIVVTGTLIRNSAPTGTNPISIGEEQIEAVGAGRSSELLASLPQVTGNFFNNIPQTEAINATASPPLNQTTNRPSLRPNPFGATDSGNSTLLLFDGARQAGIGVNGSSANPDSIPPALLQRVEVNPDGGSATYGSDAIGGVINFITKKRYDGFEVGGAVGLADSYTTWEADAAAGTDWGSGGAFIGYAFATNDYLLNSERDFYQPIDFATGLDRGLNCDTANIRIPAGGGQPIRYYAVPDTGAPSGTPFTVVPPVTGTPNVCSPGDLATLASANEQHSVLARISQDVTSNISVSLRLRFTDQHQAGLVAPGNFTAVIDNTNPFFRPIPTAGPDGALTSYTVLGNFGAAFDESERRFENSSRAWGALADVTWDIGAWRFTGFVNYDRSKSDYSNPAFNGAVQAAGFNANAGTACSVQRSAAACFNPFDIAASDPALLSNLANFFNVGEGEDEIINVRGVFDGPVFELPAGPLLVAAGFEYLRDEFSKGLYIGTDPDALTMESVVQTNTSVFGEISIPIFSDRNDLPLLRSVTLSAAGRYDKYSGLDAVFNPKLGASWMPFEFLTLRGNWSETFRAPTTIDLLGTSRANTTLGVFPACVFFCFAVDPTRELPGNTDVFVGLQGTNPDIVPQRGENWSYGADLAYNQIRASVTYFRINYLDLLSNPFNGTPVFPNLAFLVDLCPGTPGNYQCTQQQVDEFVAQAFSDAAVANIPLNSIYGLYDTRTTNLGNSRVGGWDYTFQFTQPVDWGSVFLSVSGSKTTLNETQVLPGLPYTSNIDPGAGNTGANAYGRSTHRMTVRAGANAGPLRAQATLNRTDGYDVIESATLLQDRVGSFNVVNLFLSYEFEEENSLLEGLTFTLNVNNVFDTDPPIERRTNSGSGYTNGSTLGRLIRIGVHKEF